jgi:hypothetical protein
MARNLGDEVLELAKEHGVVVKAYEVGQQHLETVRTSYNTGYRDVSGIYGAVRLESGLPYES